MGHRPDGAAARRTRVTWRRPHRDRPEVVRPAVPHRDRVGADPLEADRHELAAEIEGRSRRCGRKSQAPRTGSPSCSHDGTRPFQCGCGAEAARIKARVEKRLRELERRPQGAAGARLVRPSSGPVVQAAPGAPRFDAGAQRGRSAYSRSSTASRSPTPSTDGSRKPMSTRSSPPGSPPLVETT